MAPLVEAARAVTQDHVGGRAGGRRRIWFKHGKITVRCVAAVAVISDDLAIIIDASGVGAIDAKGVVQAIDPERSQ